MPFFTVVLPAINACLNATSALCLLFGLVAVKKRHLIVHQRFMLGALSASSLFLVGYITRMIATGTHRFAGTGGLRVLYLSLLFSHMVLAIVLVPLVLHALYLAFHRRFFEHRRVARVTWPIWMYVSVTGVVVYFMLYHGPASGVA